MLPDRMSKLLTAYVDGELNSRQRRTVVRLLQRSPEARRLFKKLKGDSMILRGLPRRKLNLDLSGSVLLTINARNIQLRPEACPPIPKPVAKQLWKKWLALFAVAALVLLAIGTASYFFFGGGSQNTMVETKETSSLATPGKGAAATLPESPIAVVHDVDPMATTPPPSSGRPKRPPQELAGILTPTPQAYQVAAPRLVRVLPLRGLDMTQFQQDLQASKNFRFDLISSDPAALAERVQVALKAGGVTLRVDPAAQASLGKRARQNYSLYAEDLTADDLKKLFLQLSVEELKKPLCDRLVVNALASADVARVLGGEPALYPPPPERQGPLGVDLTKDISEATPDQIIKNVRGGVVTDPASLSERQALLVGYMPPPADRFPTPSRDVKAFVDGRRTTYRVGATQILITIWNQEISR